ncbi:hypothetical protein RSOLAG1IB_09993 [Rhizoctonia solani AG-1 IB]|uniref:Uncharacterized protein n=1 Tax=Thanatephorus cucumeris (strain AG1-IB / isolate 7/3/14) TaxID=1108050 RepID=A0A0B7FTV2_THACB|nr:hypothetical protein RSOLAG1IB_09993 [Rhizoctonia solani AG-1 IB]
MLAGRRAWHVILANSTALRGPWGLRSTPEPSGSQPGLVILLLSPPGSGVLHEHSGAHREHTRSLVSGSGTLAEDYESVSAPEIFGSP